MKKIKLFSNYLNLINLLIISIIIDIIIANEINNNLSNIKKISILEHNNGNLKEINQIQKNISPEDSEEMNNEDEIINDNDEFQIDNNYNNSTTNIITKLNNNNNNNNNNNHNNNSYNNITIATTTSSTTNLLNIDNNGNYKYNFNSFQCFSKEEKAKHTNLMYNPRYKQSINIRVSKRATHQLLSRIFGIFLHEILDYQNVSLVHSNVDSNDSEVSKLFRQLFEIGHGEHLIDLEVWMYPNFHAIPYNVYEAGTVTYPGRYGWYTETNFITETNRFPEDLHYTLFLNPDRMSYRKYVIDKTILDELDRKFGFQKVELSKECQNYNKSCATILAPDYDETSFLSKHIDEFDLYLQIIWIDEKHFKNALDYLHNRYKSPNLQIQNRRYLFLSWSPSDIIDDKIDYIPLTLPQCEKFHSASETTCKYEMTPILKYYERKFENFKLAFNALTLFEIERENLRQILIESNLAKMNNPKISVSEIYNIVACNYLKKHPEEYLNWTKTSDKSSLYIGGIFPLTGNGKSYGNLIPFVRNAVEAINNNSSVLSNFRLTVVFNDGQCKADTVMKAFIHYFNLATPLIGVLGPACSETVEPIAGVSKHTRMTVISYSAEGALFTDRDTYPYFFRTIGSNRQYEQVYFDLFKHFEWKQIAALTEDGQKYTEYISHMDAILKQAGIDLILNKKFSKDVSTSEVNQLLQEFKNKNARIIIADIYNENARLIMCEAYHLQMTARHGYVWFLPAWISKVWNRNDSSVVDAKNLTCTQDELSEAVNGHFSLTHAAFAPDDSIMIENRTVQDWKKWYLSTGGEEKLSDYAGFAYDAVWVYALAADKLLRENPSAIYDLRSSDVIKRFSEIISKTDFNGLSGRIRFDEGGSRIDNVDILQWIDGKFNNVGSYRPEIEESNYKIIGGELTLNGSGIIWLSGEKPKDGAYQCSMAALAEVLQTTCENVNYIVIILSLVTALCILSTGSFIFWKYRYHAKLKQSAKVMKNFGIDLLSPNAKTYNTLDKWEVSKDKVVINRRLGEGAFGTVYGGEAQLDSDQGWTAVAVKTLKVGASTEDRLDFLCEAEAMKRFDHKNIIKLLGVCLQSEPIYTIMEFMLYGDLKIFLLARRHLVNEKLTEDSDISPKRLSIYALDVARGLSYLADEKYVHRDIACRNCLVNAQRVVKIGDFGMARPTFESDYYRFNRKGMLPVRWMAPESLGLGLFTPASDVWSFAVLLYEIITFGSFPYQGLTNKQALEEIKQGKILTIPNGVKPHLEGLMKACWSLDYKKRPSASEIVEYISSNPRLLTPCLDVPLSSVQMGESDGSDQWELLPGLRKRILTQPKIDILSKTSNLNDFNEKSHSSGNINEIKNNSINNRLNTSPSSVPSTSIIIHNNDDNIIENVIGNSIEENNLNGYSVMSPLLKMEPEMTNSNSSLKRYVPMYNIGKKPKLYNNNNNNNNINNSNSHNGSPIINKRAIDKGNKLFINDIELVEIRS